MISMKSFINLTKNKQVVIFLILITTFSQLFKFHSFFLEYSAWQYSDWVINYQGGFVRRGFIGEILFIIHQLFSVNLDLLVLFLVSSIIILISILLIKSLKYLGNSYINYLILLSPGFFLYSLMNSEIVGRKDILFIALIGSFVFLEKKLSRNLLTTYLIISIFVTSLSHSGLIFYAPYIISLYLLIFIQRGYAVSITEMLAISSSMLIIVLLIFFNQGTQQQVLEICGSIKDFINENCKDYGQISWIGNDMKDYFFEKRSIDINFFKSFTIYLISIIFVHLFLFIKLSKITISTKFSFFKKFNIKIFIVLLFLLTLPAYVFGLDWGRYIYISYSSIFFIFIYCLKEKIFLSNFDFKLSKFLSLILIFVYSFSWTFPFYKAEAFKLPLKKPIQRILKVF